MLSFFTKIKGNKKERKRQKEERRQLKHQYGRSQLRIDSADRSVSYHFSTYAVKEVEDELTILPDVNVLSTTTEEVLAETSEIQAEIPACDAHVIRKKELKKPLWSIYDVPAFVYSGNEALPENTATYMFVIVDTSSRVDESTTDLIINIMKLALHFHLNGVIHRMFPTQITIYVQIPTDESNPWNSNLYKNRNQEAKNLVKFIQLVKEIHLWFVLHEERIHEKWPLIHGFYLMIAMPPCPKLVTLDTLHKWRQNFQHSEEEAWGVPKLLPESPRRRSLGEISLRTLDSKKLLSAIPEQDLSANNGSVLKAHVGIEQPSEMEEGNIPPANRQTSFVEEKPELIESDETNQCEEILNEDAE